MSETIISLSKGLTKPTYIVTRLVFLDALLEFSKSELSVKLNLAAAYMQFTLNSGLTRGPSADSRLEIDLASKLEHTCRIGAGNLPKA